MALTMHWFIKGFVGFLKRQKTNENDVKKYVKFWMKKQIFRRWGNTYLKYEEANGFSIWRNKYLEYEETKIRIWGNKYSEYEETNNVIFTRWRNKY